MVFEEKPSHMTVGAIMVSVFFPLLVIAVIVVGILYYLKNQGIIWKEKKPLEPRYNVHFTPGDPDHPNRPPYSAQSSTNGMIRVFYFTLNSINLLRKSFPTKRIH